jgi:hypothetical protein
VSKTSASSADHERSTQDAIQREAWGEESAERSESFASLHSLALDASEISAGKTTEYSMYMSPWGTS